MFPPSIGILINTTIVFVQPNISEARSRGYFPWVSVSFWLVIRTIYFAICACRSGACLIPLPRPTIYAVIVNRVDCDLVDVANMAIRPAGCCVEPNDSVVHRGPFFVPRCVVTENVCISRRVVVFYFLCNTIASLFLGEVLGVKVWIAVLVGIFRLVDVIYLT